MLKFLINLVARSLEFSKTEAKGTLVLLFFLISVLTISKLHRLYVKKDVNGFNPTNTVELEKWAAQVQASIKPKEVERNIDLHVPAVVEKGVNGYSATTPTRRLNVISGEHDSSIEIADINTSPRKALQRIRGIGPVLSKRIVDYRSLLGGFADMGQLEEVYGLKEDVIQELSKFYYIGSTPSKIFMNADSAKVLARHPYISYDLAWNIINYRRQHGDIQSIKDLEKIKSVDTLLLEKLRPYLE